MLVNDDWKIMYEGAERDIADLRSQLSAAREAMRGIANGSRQLVFFGGRGCLADDCAHWDDQTCNRKDPYCRIGRTIEIALVKLGKMPDELPNILAAEVADRRDWRDKFADEQLRREKAECSISELTAQLESARREVDELEKQKLDYICQIADISESYRTFEPCGHAKNFQIGDEHGNFTCTVCRIAELKLCAERRRVAVSRIREAVGQEKHEMGCRVSIWMLAQKHIEYPKPACNCWQSRILATSPAPGKCQNPKCGHDLHPDGPCRESIIWDGEDDVCDCTWGVIPASGPADVPYLIRSISGCGMEERMSALKATGAVIAVFVIPVVFGWWLADHPNVFPYALSALGLLLIIGVWRLFYRIFKFHEKG
jgi:hypothetical protein